MCEAALESIKNIRGFYLLVFFFFGEFLTMQNEMSINMFSSKTSIILLLLLPGAFVKIKVNRIATVLVMSFIHVHEYET